MIYDFASLFEGPMGHVWAKLLLQVCEADFTKLDKVRAFLANDPSVSAFRAMKQFGKYLLRKRPFVPFGASLFNALTFMELARFIDAALREGLVDDLDDAAVLVSFSDRCFEDKRAVSHVDKAFVLEVLFNCIYEVA